MYSRFKCIIRVVIAAVLLCLSISSVSAAQNASDFVTVAEAAGKARENGNREEALRLYQQAVRVRPEWTEGWWYLGTLLYDADRFAEAVPSFQKVTQLAPELGSAWSFLGLSEFETKNFPAAANHLEKGIALPNPDDPEIDRVARFHLALLRIRSEEFDRAESLLVPEFTSGAISEQVRTALGLLLLRVPLLPQEIDPAKDSIVSAAGELKLQLLTRNGSGALSSIKALVSRNTNIPAAHEVLARCYDALHLSAEAKKERAARSSTSSGAASDVAETEMVAFFSRGSADSNATKATVTEARNSSEFEELSRRAAAAQSAGDVESALPLYEKALQLRPDWDEGRWILSMDYYSSKRFSDAISSLKIWLERNPNSGTAWAVLGLSEFEIRDYENALIHLQRGRSLGWGGSADSIRNARYHEAILLNRRSEFSRASQILSAETSPGILQEEIQVALGMVFLRVPRLPEEVPAPERPLVRRAGEAAVLLASSKYDHALPKLKQLAHDFPQTPFVHYIYGAALSSLSLFDEAAAQFEAEAEISPQSELPLIELVSLNLQRHAATDALIPGKRAVELAPNSAAAHYAMGRAYLELGKNDLAIQELTRAAKLSPGSPEVHFQLARAYARENLAEKASSERAIFAHLNALAETQRSSTGSQSYGAVRPSSAPISEPDAAQDGGAVAPPRP